MLKEISSAHSVGREDRNRRFPYIKSIPTTAASPFVTDLMNPTGLAFDRAGVLYASSRYDGIIYQVTPTGNMSVYVEGMGVATGIALTARRTCMSATAAARFSKSAGPTDLRFRHSRTIDRRLSSGLRTRRLSVRHGPTTSSFDAVYRVSNAGEVDTFYRGLGRPQGLAFDAKGRLYVAASLRGGAASCGSTVGQPRTLRFQVQAL